jgi:hypothetical protein
MKTHRVITTDRFLLATLFLVWGISFGSHISDRPHTGSTVYETHTSHSVV